MNIIIIEDDLLLQNYLADSLKSISKSITVFSSLDFLNDLNCKNMNLGILVLDRLVGDNDTKDYFTQIKLFFPNFQILVLSAIDSASEKAELLMLGADDYLSKPFDLAELKARIVSLSRRVVPLDSLLMFGDLKINKLARVVTCHNVEIPLSAKEYLLIDYLISANNKITSKDDLLNAIWGTGTFLETNTLFVTIANLRKKLVEYNSTVNIKNIRNIGYLIES